MHRYHLFQLSCAKNPLANDAIFPISVSIQNIQLVRFAVVGGAGFIVDASVLTSLVKFTVMDLYSSRAISFILAVSVTWYLNRVWTFKTAKNKRQGAEYARHILVQVIGALINLSVYVYCIESVEQMARYPVFPLAIGALIALVFNYFFSRKLVFIKT